MRLDRGGNHRGNRRNREPFDVGQEIVASDILLDDWLSCDQVFLIGRLKLIGTLNFALFGHDIEARLFKSRKRICNRSRLGPGRSGLDDRRLPRIDDLVTWIAFLRLDVRSNLDNIVRQQVGFAKRQFEFAFKIERRLIDVGLRVAGFGNLRRDGEGMNLSIVLVSDGGWRRLDAFGLEEHRLFKLGNGLRHRLFVHDDVFCYRLEPRLFLFGYSLEPGLFDRSRLACSRLRHGPRRVVAVERAKQFVFEIEGGVLTHRLLVSLQFLQLLDGRPGIVTDDPGEFGQRIIVCQYIEFSRPASCELFVCHALHSQLPVSLCQCIVGKW
ncbi:hypothetical protein ACIQUG_02545 [Ensifer sp. NPDC090286]|uniref:hypothetical protein n=1 Tax=Ensifer sp. NPDC090286 TaxID=3363991 RepID=UPI00383BC4EA